VDWHILNLNVCDILLCHRLLVISGGTNPFLNLSLREQGVDNYNLHNLLHSVDLFGLLRICTAVFGRVKACDSPA
jgi:hypothetical protein